MNMSRRGFLKIFGQVTLTYALGGAGLLQYGRHIEAQRVVVEKVQTPLSELNPALAGLKIVQLSDIHIDAYTRLEVVREAVALANSLRPDVTVLTGDYVSKKPEAIFELAPVLASLNARQGVFAALGNHEHWTDAALIQTALERTGIPVLVNEGIPLGMNGQLFFLAGLDDPWSGRPALDEALHGWKPGMPAILLAHEPDFADTFSQDGRASLQLSGHTHGGQVRLPGFGPFMLPPHGKKYDQGLFYVNGMWLYTNRGLGTAPVPYRINCPPEVTEITLAPR